MAAAPVVPPMAEEKSVVAMGLEAFGITRYVCSLHFMPVNEVRDFRTKREGGYNTNYRIPAVKDAESHPEVLAILDAYQRVYQGDDRTPKWAPIPEPSINIARDIVHAVTGADDSDPSLSAPAVWVSRASRVPRTQADWSTWGKPEFAKNFPEFFAECVAYRKRQWRFCEKRIAEADTWHVKKMPLEISNIDRAAARYIGANRAQHEWMDGTTLGKEMPCPFCGYKASSDHPVCGNCQRTINPALMRQIEDSLKAS